MPSAFVRSMCLILAIAVLIGCSKSGDPNRKETSPVTGEVTVDGKAVAGVKVDLHDVKGFDTAAPSISSGTTDEQGKFSISTYDINDGAPVGDYTATFTWAEAKLMNQGEDSPDKLKGKYSSPQSSTFKLKVESGKPTDMGKIDLKTK